MPYEEPEFLPWDGRRAPMTFVGGYLGAGKTTAINEILAGAGRRIAVIVNDAGAVNVDASLIRGSDGAAIELTDGCICCTSLDEMGAALDLLRARPRPPDHVVVELSGVAEPTNLLPWAGSAGFLLDGVVTLVAADQLLDSALPRWIRAHLEAQVSAADLLVLTKTDLVSGADAERALSALAALAHGVPIVDGGLGRRDAGALGRFLAIGGHQARDAAGVPGPTLFDLHDTHAVSLPVPITRAECEAIVADLPARFPGRAVVRAKGIVDLLDGNASGPALLQLVGSRLEVVPLYANEHQEPTDLVVITVRDGSRAAAPVPGCAG